MTMPLNDLQCGQSGLVSGVHGGGAMRQRLLDLGILPGTQVERVLNSPAGDPACYRIRGAMIALRGQDATQITIVV